MTDDLTQLEAAFAANVRPCRVTGEVWAGGAKLRAADSDDQMVATVYGNDLTDCIASMWNWLRAYRAEVAA